MTTEAEIWRVQLPTGELRAFSLDALDQAFDAGLIHAGTMVLAPGATEWAPLGLVAGLDSPDPEPVQTPSLSPMAIANDGQFHASYPPPAPLPLEDVADLSDDALKPKRGRGQPQSYDGIVPRLSRMLESDAIAEGDETAVAGDGTQPHTARVSKRQQKPTFSGARQFRSTDGFDILVGKRATDNDHLTFRVAGPNDLWLHAADYPGSHVVVRNPNRKEIPQRTLLEAAQLAAFYSSGKSQPKAAVNYTQRKYVHKPRRSAPGLVNLASFKTVLVEPKVPFDE